MLKVEMHPYIQAVHLAYANHLPLVLTPDMIWHLIASGVAMHVRKNPDRLRHKFVHHQGRETITVRRDDFVLDEMNPWDEAIADFASQITSKTANETGPLFTANFSTTSPESLVASQIVLMDAMEKYFQFAFVTLCGRLCF